MATSATYTYSPAASDLVLSAYARCGVRRTEVLTQHLLDAANEAQLFQVELSSRQPNLWTTDTLTVALTKGTATYTLPVETVTVITVYISTPVSVGSATFFDRVISPLSMSEYAAFPSKADQGPATSFWFNRQTTPQITLYPVPDQTGNYVMKILRLRQLQDAKLQGGVNLDMPYRWLDAFVAGLAKRLSLIYAPDRFAMLSGEYERAWNIAASEDMEDVALSIAPGIGGYFS